MYSHVAMGAEAYFAFCAPGANFSALVHAGTGNGSAARAVLPALQECRRRGLHVVRSSRVLGGGTVLRNAEVKDDELGFVVAADPTPQKAFVLVREIKMKI